MPEKLIMHGRSRPTMARNCFGGVDRAMADDVGTRGIGWKVPPVQLSYQLFSSKYSSDMLMSVAPGRSDKCTNWLVMAFSFCLQRRNLQLESISEKLEGRMPCMHRPVYEKQRRRPADIWPAVTC